MKSNENEKNSQIKYVCVDNVTNKRKLIDSVSTPINNIPCIPLEITSKYTTEALLITGNYEKLFKKLLRSFTKCFKALELDSQIHESILNDYTGNRRIHETRKCYYFFVDPDEPDNTDNFEQNFKFGAFIWHDNPNNLDVYEDKRFIQLTQDLENLLIEQQPLYEHDNEVVEFAAKFKKVYEHLFENYLKNIKPNTAIYATLVPKNPKEEDQWATKNANTTSLLFYFDSLQYNEENNKIIDFVNAKTFDLSEMYKFHRKICTKYGPYQNTYLWCTHYNTGRSTDTGENEYYLDLPAQLYRLLDTD